jgi:hypothetical protein
LSRENCEDSLYQALKLALPDHPAAANSYRFHFTVDRERAGTSAETVSGKRLLMLAEQCELSQEDFAASLADYARFHGRESASKAVSESVSQWIPEWDLAQLMELGEIEQLLKVLSRYTSGQAVEQRRALSDHYPWLPAEAAQTMAQAVQNQAS